MRGFPGGITSTRNVSPFFREIRWVEAEKRLLTQPMTAASINTRRTIGCAARLPLRSRRAMNRSRVITCSEPAELDAPTASATASAAEKVRQDDDNGRNRGAGGNQRLLLVGCATLNVGLEGPEFRFKICSRDV